ncbi:glycosyltransferase [Halalkalibacillus halophilus]|uniref:glycosyltransferase n=1 Tax=Halalkalibacillus halophilus TaxID=392827 RepID=UPI0004020B72|nr:glycosyltransferase [Halalkalibacillus halophilus]
MKWFHRSFKKVFVPSISTKEKLIFKNVHSDIEIWGRGVNQAFYTPAKRSDSVRKKYKFNEENILLYVGRIAPEKNLPTVIETFRSLADHIKKNTRLLIVGDGPLLKSLSETETDNITYTGFLQGEELAEVYASSDLFLFPSTTETFGNVVLEAMSSGLPVIGANEGGVKHLINDGENGYACNANNISEFVDATTRLLDNKILCESFAYKARQFALTKSWALVKSCRDAADSKEFFLSKTGS